MKEATSVAIILALAIALATAGMIYPATMEVIKVDFEADEVYLETSTGHVFVMTAADDWMEGDVASLLMFSQGTMAVEDDIILSARYSGWAIQH